ncbi:head-tail adaptor protein [Phaeobacter gallaeciensis]|nr:head-tail adaptor protein [Phaeobacter gallaeciensis]MDE4059768.1 head-tail adaptor protein [Phaeobacter gallaeciensis]MDE4122595.1 head-tail adaptor protein [Phaeobacter gallaeciensis]MDE4127256.1 head-tail adaptor protein [Phaeobacter gallaeciensis]
MTVEREADAGTLDAYGNPVAASWGALGVFWADLRETTGKERLAAGRLESAATATMRLRASAEAQGITPADRVQARGETWKIIGGPIDPTGRGQLVEFTLECGGAVQ